MISIIIPTYNNVQLLTQLIKTILLEKNLIYEIIIIDDFSTDNTQAICKKFTQDNIKYYRNSQNVGTTESRMRGLQYAKGNYIKFFDDDDLWVSNMLIKQRRYLIKYNCDFVFGDYRVNNQIDNVRYNRNLIDYDIDFSKQILIGPGPFLQTCLFTAEYIKNCIIYFDKQAEPSEDWDFFISLSKQNPRVAHINYEIFQWNLNQKSQSANYKQETLALEYIINKHKTYIQKNASKKILASHYRVLGSRFYFVNNSAKSSYYYKQAFLIFPYSIKNFIHQILQIFPNNLKIFSYNCINKKII